MDLLSYLCVLWINFAGFVSGWGDADKAFYQEADMQGVSFMSSKHHVTTGDTAVLSCSFDALPRQYMLMYGYDSLWLEWVKVLEDGRGKLLAVGDKLKTADKRLQVVNVPHHRALSILVIRQVRARDHGKYRCQLSLSTIRHKYFDLEVTAPSLSIIHNKTRLILKEGQNLDIRCNATGHPSPSIHWTRKIQKGQTYFPNGKYIIWGKNIFLETLRQEDSGHYTCHIDNFVSKRKQVKFHVIISDSPRYLEVFQNGINVGYLKTGPWWPTPEYDLPFTLMCLTKSKSPARIIWFKNGHAIDPEKRSGMYIKTKKGRYSQLQSELYIRRFKNFDLGKYTCRASTMAGSLKYTFKLDELKGWPPAGSTPKKKKKGKILVTDDEELTDVGSGSGDDSVVVGSGSGAGQEERGRVEEPIKFDSNGRITIIKAADQTPEDKVDIRHERRNKKTDKSSRKKPKKIHIENNHVEQVKPKTGHKKKNKISNQAIFPTDSSSQITLKIWGVETEISNNIPEDNSYISRRPNITETNETELNIMLGDAAVGSGDGSEETKGSGDDGWDDDEPDSSSGHGPIKHGRKKSTKKKDDIYFN